MDLIILLLPSLLVEAVTMWQYSTELFVPVRPLRTRAITLTILYISLFIISLFENSGLNIICYLLFNLGFLVTQFQIKFPLAIFHSVILTAIMSVSELLILGVISYFAPDFLSSVNMSFALYGIFSKTLFFSIAYILSHLISSRATDQKPYDRSMFVLILISVLSVFIMFTFFCFYIGEGYAPASSLDIMVTISAIALMGSNFLIFGIHQYTQKKNKEFIDMQLLLQKEQGMTEYYEMLLTQTENQRILIHDIKKHLQAIELLNQNKESVKITSYINQLMDSSDLKENLQLCDNEMLNAILCHYQRLCRNNQIEFTADIRSGTLKNILQHDITSLFCNLLDNAIDAVENISDPFIDLTVQKREQTPYIVIVVINSCLNKPLSNENGIPVSSKKDKSRHGFGIKSIQKVVKQYNGNLQMYFDDATNTFHTIITLRQ